MTLDNLEQQLWTVQQKISEIYAGKRHPREMDDLNIQADELLHRIDIAHRNQLKPQYRNRSLV